MRHFIIVGKQIFIVCYMLLIAIGCSSRQNIPIHSFNHSENLKIWSMADIQPRNSDEYIHFENAVEDINENISDISLALVAGDILHYTDKTEVLKWYKKTKRKSYIKKWYEIAGNHDAKNLKAYKEILNSPLHYSVETGNFLFLFISDTEKTPEQEVSEEVFNWWKNSVINNQDKIIITVTHAYLKQGGLFLSSINSRNIDISDKFAEVLKKYKVDIWISGHTHAANFLWGKVNTVKELNNTLFINTSIMRKDFARDVSSRVLIFKNGAREVLVRLRYHKDKEYDRGEDFIHKLSHRASWSRGEKFVIKEWDAK